jgi:hypothetical protein
VIDGVGATCERIVVDRAGAVLQARHDTGTCRLKQFKLDGPSGRLRMANLRDNPAMTGGFGRRRECPRMVAKACGADYPSRAIAERLSDGSAKGKGIGHVRMTDLRACPNRALAASQRPLPLCVRGCNAVQPSDLIGTSGGES